MFRYCIYFREKQGVNPDPMFGGVVLVSPVQLDEGRVLLLPSFTKLFSRHDPKDIPEKLKETFHWEVDEVIDICRKMVQPDDPESENNTVLYENTVIRVSPYNFKV